MSDRFAIQKHGREYAVVDTGFFRPTTIAGHGPAGEREAQRLCRAWNEKGPERRRAELSGRQEDIDLADMAEVGNFGGQYHAPYCEWQMAHHADTLLALAEALPEKE